MTAAAGTSFRLYGIARSYAGDGSDCVRLRCDERVTTGDSTGSRLLGWRWCDETWADTAAGQRAGLARALELNRAEHARMRRSMAGWGGAR